MRREISRRLPYNDVHTKDEWARRFTRLLDRKHGAGANSVFDRGPGRLGRGCHCGSNALRLDDRASDRIWHGQGDGGRQPSPFTGSLPSRRRSRRSWAIVVALGLAYGLVPVLERLDMKMIVSPTLAAVVFVGTQVLLPGGRTPLIPQGRVARPGDGFPGLSCSGRREDLFVAVLLANDVTKTYRDGRNEVPVLRGFRCRWRGAKSSPSWVPRARARRRCYASWVACSPRPAGTS